MKINYDLNKLHLVLSDFFNVTMLKISILDSKFHTIASVENESQQCFCSTIQSYDNCQGCKNSDKILLEECSHTRKIAISVCHAGLTNIAFPILLHNEIVGYVIMGQVREVLDFKSIQHLLPAQADFTELQANFESLTFYSRSQLESAARTASMLTISILAEDMIHLEPDELAEHAANYIQTHLRDKISLDVLCKELKTSKNILYKSFQSKYNCTITQYIITCRMNKAEELLLSTKLSIREIAENVGIPDEGYFCKCFKRIIGYTPLQYRNKPILQ